MNKIILIGNLTRDPETRTTQTGLTVCSFGIAVNRRRSNQNNGQEVTDFFNITAWRQLGELCQKYLAKGRKVCITGSVALNTFTGRDGTPKASMEVTADDVEFLSSRADAEAMGSAPANNAGVTATSSGFTAVETDELPF